jgi:Flp pilus assembly protein TadD
MRSIVIDQPARSRTAGSRRSLAAAHFIAGDFDAAVEWAQKSVERKPEWFRAHHWLIAGLARSGRLEEARSAVTEYLEVFPNGSLRDANRYPLKLAAHKESLFLGLRKAGLPE